MRQIDLSHPTDSVLPQPGLTVEHETAPATAPEIPDNDPAPRRRRSHLRRFRALYLGILVLLLLVFVPPLVNLNRYQRRIAISIGNSLGRPVSLDGVSLTLLPLPGFTIQNLVVGEDPAFGSEPIIRANSVQVTLRISSLWRRQVEFSTISFTDPSVNLVHTADGKWNIEGILLQASRIETAPTAQRHAGPAPRFPYIEASGARLNFKQEQEKLPFSLTDADFALWLPDPHQWHLRLRAHPTRTDINATDTGTVEVEATLGAASSLSQVPLNLEGQWRDAQLGEATRVLFSHDAGWRGQMNLSTHIRGTFGESAVSTRIRLIDLRPADFVPEAPLTAEAECFATATGLFHAFEDLRCSWPPATSPQTPSVALTGSIPNVHHAATSSLRLGTSQLPASTLLTWLRALTPHVPDDLSATGTLSGSIGYEPSETRNQSGHWQGQFTLADATLKAPFPATDTPGILLSSDIHLHTPAGTPVPTRRHKNSAPAPSSIPPRGLVLAPTPLFLGGHDPATLEGHFDSSGYTMHLSGMATADRLKALAQALPPLGDGLLKALPPNHPDDDPFRIDLTATRPWRGSQSWLDNTVQSVQNLQPRHPARHFAR
ncbi:MAG TPA: AsmA family protein [Edaphobacter sp.]|jgi:AsmA protein|nr:AsmA family protein [Edaphobacter sp.]